MFIFIVPSNSFAKKVIAKDVHAQWTGTQLSIWAGKLPEQRLSVHPGDHILVHPTKTSIKMKSPKDRLARYAWRCGFYNSTRMDVIASLSEVIKKEGCQFIGMASGQAGFTYTVGKDGKPLPGKWYAETRTKPAAFKEMLESVFGEKACNTPLS